MESSRSSNDLNEAVTTFKNNYIRFAQKHRKFIRIKEEVDATIGKVTHIENVKESAKVFQYEILKVMRIVGNRRQAAETRWTGKAATFIGSLPKSHSRNKGTFLR